MFVLFCCVVDEMDYREDLFSDKYGFSYNTYPFLDIKGYLKKQPALQIFKVQATFRQFTI